MESAQEWRAFLGHGDWKRTPRVAHRVLRDGNEIPGRDAGYPRGWGRSDLPASRERDRPVGSNHRKTVCAILAALRVSQCRIAEDVEVARQHLYASRVARDGSSAGGRALSSGLGAVSQEAEFHL